MPKPKHTPKIAHKYIVEPEMKQAMEQFWHTTGKIDNNFLEATLEKPKKFSFSKNTDNLYLVQDV